MATFALIPGAGGDPWEWHLLVPELEARGHRAIAIQLPSEDETAGWSEYASSVVDALDGLGGVVLVAASMAGFTAPIVCTRRQVDLLVLVNAMIPEPGETFGTLGDAYRVGRGPTRLPRHARADAHGGRR